MTSREIAVRSGIRAEIVTIVWMAIEAALAVVAGIRAHSVLVTAFGFDSVIELLSGVVLLCAYIIITSAIGVLRHVEAEESALGLAVAGAAVVLMPLLAMWKRRINRELQSAALRADIAETSACGYMAAIVVAGVLLNHFLHIWWIEYAASLVLLIWIARETKEAFEAARGHGHGHDDGHDHDG